jgi:hypothetical protein
MARPKFNIGDEVVGKSNSGTYEGLKGKVISVHADSRDGYGTISTMRCQECPPL